MLPPIFIIFIYKKKEEVNVDHKKKTLLLKSGCEWSVPSLSGFLCYNVLLFVLY